MTRSYSGFVVGGCVVAVGLVMAVLPLFFHAGFDPHGGALVSSNLQMFGVVIAFFGVVLLLEAAYSRLVAESRVGTPPAAPRTQPG